nr:hypothetical protein [Bacteroidota bacterium]
MITYKVIDEEILIEEYSGKVNREEYIRLKKTQVSRTHYLKMKGIVMDLRKSTMSFSKSAIKELVLFILTNKRLFENKSIAILTKTMDQLNFGYFFKDQLSEHMVTVRIEQFSSKQAAMKWMSGKG